MIRKRRAFFALLAVFALATVACSSDSSSTSASSPSSPDPSTATSVTATVKDFAIAIDPTSAAAGEVTFSITNEGPSTHEFVVVQTDTAPADLPVTDGLVSEDGITVIGEAEDIASGATPTLTLALEAGKYVIMCNIVGHYEQGMNVGLTVT